MKKRDDILEKQEILVTVEEFKEFRKKYNFNRVELIPIFNQGINSIDKFEMGKIEILDNQEFVKELIDDEEKLKARVQELYDKGKIIDRIYFKVFNEKKVEKIKYNGKKVIDEVLMNKILDCQKKYNISDSAIAKILGITRPKFEQIKNGKYIKESEEKIFEEKLKDKNSLIKAIQEIEKKGIFSKKLSDKLITNILYIYREETKINSIEKGRRCNRRENNVETQKISDEILQKKLQRKRDIANFELQKEIAGRKSSYICRQNLIEFVYLMFEQGKKIEIEDIDFIKDTIIRNHELISNYTLKLIIIGSLRNNGYIIARKKLNELTEKIKDVEYKEKLLKYKEILDDEYTKIVIKKMKDNGNTKEEIIGRLGISKHKYTQLNKKTSDDNERS